MSVAPAPDVPLLDAELRQLLARLRLAARRVRSGEPGARAGGSVGARLELADYRDYQPGDDLRDLDWAAYARLEALVVRQYAPSSRQDVHVVVDDSASMAAGTPDKWRCARRLALTVAVLGLVQRHPTSLHLVHADERRGPFERASAQDAVAAALERAPARHAGDLGAALVRAAHRLRSPGRYVLVSDLWGGGGLERTLLALVRPQQHWSVIHVLGADELDPPLAGSCELTEAESGATLAIEVDAAARDAYRREIGRVVERWTEVLGRARVGYALADAGRPLGELVLGPLRAGGVLA